MFIINLLTFLLHFHVSAQTTYNTNISKADKVIYYTINKSNENKILLINKYIDTTKTIYLRFGTIMQEVKKSAMKIIPIQLSGNYPLTLTNDKGRLKINCTFFNIEGKLSAKIKDNKLLKIDGRSYQQSATDQWIEVIDENNIPVLQIDLDKKKNTINVSGMFFDEDGHYAVITSVTGGMRTFRFDQPYLKMSQRVQDSTWFEVKKIARQILREVH